MRIMNIANIGIYWNIYTLSFIRIINKDFKHVSILKSKYVSKLLQNELTKIYNDISQYTYLEYLL